MSHEPAPISLARLGSLISAPWDGPLDVADTSFFMLTTGPGGLSVDGRRLGHGLPRRRIGLDELPAILMHPATSFETRDETWRHLVTRARTEGPAWVVGAVGVALPGLRAAAHRLRRVHRGDAEAEVLFGFLTALRVIDLGQPRVCPRLCNAAYTAARAALRASEPAASGEANFAPGSVLPPSPFGHPDFVIARAVRAGVITAREADLIGATRLEDVSLADYARRLGRTPAAVYQIRARAEARLVAALRAGKLSNEVADVVAEATQTTVVDW